MGWGWGVASWEGSAAGVERSEWSKREGSERGMDGKIWSTWTAFSSSSLTHPPAPRFRICATRDGSGTIDIGELSDALKNFGIYGSDEEELLKSADTNGDGQIDYQEFSFLLRNKNQGLQASRGAKKTISRY
jgi:hypothetical protein